MARKPPRNIEDYIPAKDAADSLRDMAQRIGGYPDGTLVRYSVQFRIYRPEDGNTSIDVASRGGAR